MLERSSWQCGPISTGGVAVGFTNIVAIILGVLLYYNHLSSFSMSIIVVSFGCVVLVLVNGFLVYGSVNTKPGFVLPWLAIYVLATLAFIVFMGIKWHTFNGYKAASIGVCGDDDSAKVKERSSAKVSLLSDINADFSPFRNPKEGGGDKPKMKVFLPKPMDCDSDADYSFDTSRAEFSFSEGNNMCKIEEDQA